MELRTLQYFIAVSELLSFSAAAQRLGITQSAVSRQIQLLEQELRVRLFDRIGRKVFLTTAGSALLERSYEVQKGLVSLAARASELSAGNQGTLRIGATPQTLESLVARVVQRFVEKHPDIRIELVEDGSANLGRAVEAGEIHLAVGALDVANGLASRPLFPLIVLVALPRGHRLVERDVVEVSELADERMLLLRDGFMTRRLFDGASKVAHISPRILLESASPHCLLALVHSGLGIAVIPSTVRFSRDHPRVVPLAQNGSTLGVWMQAVWDPRRYTQAALHNFMEALSRHTQTNYPGKSLGAGRLLRTPRKAKARG